MNAQDIKARLAAAEAVVIEKGMISPDFEICLKGSSEDHAYLRFSHVSGAESEFCYGSNINEILSNVDSFVASLKSADIAAKEAAVASLGRSIDLLNAAGVDSDLIASAKDAFTAMTKNLLTHQGSAQ